MLSSITVLSQANANPCAGLWLGQIVANPERCDQYYMCVLTRPVPVDCEPNEVFDITEKMCVPGDPTTCEIGERTTEEQSSSTTVTFSESTTTSEPPVDLGTICRDVFFAAKPYPNSLEIYVGCIRGIGVLFTCLENEFFHPVINECIIRPEQTTDSPGTQTTSRTDTTVEIETTTSYNQPETTVENEITSFFPETTSQIYSTTLSPLDGICNGIYYNFIEHPTKCALYIFCFDEKEFVRQCPEFKIFDIESESCKYGDQETCDFLIENTIPITEPQPPTTEIIESTTVFNPCAGIQNGNVPNFDDCTKFFRCFMQRSAPSQCQDGYIFDQEQLICVSGDPEKCLTF